MITPRSTLVVFGNCERESEGIVSWLYMISDPGFIPRVGESITLKGKTYDVKAINHNYDCEQGNDVLEIRVSVVPYQAPNAD